MNKKGKIITSLRKKGKTYGEIEKITGYPKSTVGWWLRDFMISKQLQKQILRRSREKWRKSISDYNDKYARIRSEAARAIREKTESKASKDIKKLSIKDIKLIGIALYWAEGSKKYRWSIRFANSDSSIITVMMRFLREVCNIQENKMKARVHLYPDMDEKKTINYWRKITKLPRKQFLKSQTQISRASKGKRPRNTLPFGTLHITAGNTEDASKVKGWICGLIKQS